VEVQAALQETRLERERLLRRFAGLQSELQARGPPRRPALLAARERGSGGARNVPAPGPHSGAVCGCHGVTFAVLLAHRSAVHRTCGSSAWLVGSRARVPGRGRAQPRRPAARRQAEEAELRADPARPAPSLHAQPDAAAGGADAGGGGRAAPAAHGGGERAAGDGGRGGRRVAGRRRDAHRARGTRHALHRAGAPATPAPRRWSGARRAGLRLQRAADAPAAAWRRQGCGCSGVASFRFASQAGVEAMHVRATPDA
jgi:hypothetical protein